VIHRVEAMTERGTVLRILKLRSIATAITLLLSVVISACSSSPTQPPRSQLIVVTTTPPGVISEDPQGKIGDQVVADNFSVTVVSVEEFKDYSLSKPEPRNLFLAVELLVQSNDPIGIDVNPLFARIQDTSGNIYAAVFGGKGPMLETRMGANQLLEEEEVRGWVTFEIPENAKDLMLVYQPVSLTSDVNVRIDLKR